MKETTENLLEKIAGESGLAVVVTNDGGDAVASVNNNSMCEALYSSAEFAPRCAEFCGRAFAMAQESGSSVSYQCYAGFDCLAVPLKAEKPLVAIVGRAFTRSENFRRATERAIEGDWQTFDPGSFFENVHIKSSAKSFEKAARDLEGLSFEGLNEEKGRRGDGEKGSKEEEQVVSEEIVSDDSVTLSPEDAEEIAVWRSLFGSLFNLTYEAARLSVVGFLSKRYGLVSVAWLERIENSFESVFATGALKGREFKVNLPANDKLLFDALEGDLALNLRERRKNGEDSTLISLFPVSVGGEVQHALIAADEIEESLKRRISRFCRTVAPQLEILRLREEVTRRSSISEAVEKFNARLKNPDAEDFWSNLTRISAELLRAERSSLLIFDEKNDSLTVKAAIGATAESINGQTEAIGERVAKIVLKNGEPVVVGDVSAVGLKPAPADWKYKTNSFISYPFVIGERRIGVFNVADKADGAAYGAADLKLLQAIAPQLAVLIDRANLKDKAGEYEQLSVTDALTGLLNRRYLEERLAEEIKRSNRYGYPMSFMMIDVDNFKSYNDNFGHAEGDKALKLVAQSFRETLRSADIAARYGGEEFSILLPQTTSIEAETIAERVRESIEAAEFPNRQVTISVGIASCCLQINSVHDLIVAADKALYEAKRQGRNNVQVYEKLKDDDDEKK